MAGRKIALGKGWKMKDGKPIQTGKGKNVAQKIAERKSKRVRVVKAIATVIAMCIVAPEVQAKTVRICNIFDHCWLEDDGKPTARRTYRKRKPEVRAYVKRERERDEAEDKLICMDKVRVVGSQWATADGAEDSARKAWMEQVRWRFGESAMTIESAKDYAKRCSRSSIGELANSVLHRCEVQARPCRPVFESK